MMKREFAFNVISYLERMLKKNNINFSSLLKRIVLKFSKEDCILCFNYILQNKNDTNLLNQTIRIINETLYKENLAQLIDFILTKPQDGHFLNLKVLAIKTIAKFKDTSAVSSLLYCLNDNNSNYKIKLAAADALGKIGDKNAFESLSNILCNEEEKSVYVKESAVQALGMLGDNRALDIFNSIINTKQMFLDKFSYLKEKMIEAMSKFDIEKNEKAIEILKNSILDNSPSVRISTIETLMNSGYKESYNLIQERLEFDDNLEVKKNALIALYNISDVEILNKILKEEKYCTELKKFARELIEEYENE